MIGDDNADEDGGIWPGTAKTASGDMEREVESQVDPFD